MAGGGQGVCFVYLSWRSSERRFRPCTRWKVTHTLIAHYPYTDYDPVKYKVAMGAAQSAPIPSPHVSAVSESVCEVNQLNPKGLKPYAIR